MPIKISNKNKTTLGIATFCLALAGCNQQATIPASWGQNVQGNYLGLASSYSESVQFHSNGTYEHHVYQGGKRIHSDSGKWAVAKDSVRIDLSPDESFSQFYDPMSRTFSPKPQPFLSYVYWPILKGNVPTGISASVEYEYSLERQTGNLTNALERMEK
jgi:hypothetical protein